ncbi:hypothetical protein KQY27_09095 [Methanobrevibacter sp. TMH8]|uniref:hypothetical protein n=1 Tax=Methanobrevibacter sp. TMH8 TaxID=2848611 RepID=UPI001CCDCC28|nr:hypothetical protein [Methanobrevibacter sp. TMH8]MBZ9571701.1 hypothetical protein [Methanobrevibacter sp. TMH8]
MNKKTAFFVVFLFLYLFCTFDSISMTENGFNINSMEQLEEIYENPHKPHEKQDEHTNKLKNLKTIPKIRKKDKILEDGDIRIIDNSEANLKDSNFHNTL